jgi:GxxExxY protein
MPASNPHKTNAGPTRRQPEPAAWTIDEVAKVIVDTGYRLHFDLGPGLFESVYEAILAKMLEARGLSVRRQVPVPIRYQGVEIEEGFRADLIVNDIVLVELKSIAAISPVHQKQVLTYLRLLGMPIGLLINFGTSTYKEGVSRIANRPRPLE